MAIYGFGIIGCGMISEFHAAAIAELENAKLVAVSSRHEENARKLTDKYGVPWHKDYKELVARDDVDIVCVCTPSGVHLEPAVAAAEAKKHVVVEKPIEVTLDRGDQIIQTCDENKVRLCAIFPYRFQECTQIIKQAVDEGRFGVLTVADCYNKWWRTQEYYDNGGWRGTWKLDGGGALMNQGIHAVDLLQWFMGPVKSLYALTDTRCHDRIEVEDTAVAVLRFANGAMGVIEATTSIHPGFARRMEVHGSGGSAVLDGEDILTWDFAEERPEDAEVRERFAQKTSVGASAPKAAGASDPRAISHELHRCQFEDFLRALETGAEPMVDGREGRKALEIILAIYESAKRREAVKLPL